MQYPQWLQWYKKPAYVDPKAFADQKAQATSAPSSSRSSPDSRPIRDIPSKLSLEKILKNQTCSPMSMYDFYKYLKHIEHSPENLEFYVWFKNYEAGRLTEALTRPQTKWSSDDTLNYPPSTQQSMTTSDEKAFGLCESQEAINMDCADMYARISSLVDPSCGTACLSSTNYTGKIRAKFSHKQPTIVTDDNRSESSAEVVVTDLSTLVSDQEAARCSELQTICTLFLLPGAPKELNIPFAMRTTVLASISSSTDAVNLKPVADHCYLLLKSCSHRNFLRLGVSNGTFETICMATSLGIVLVVTGILSILLLASTPLQKTHFQTQIRWKALGIWPMLFTGLSLILSGLRGSCFFLLLFSRRQPLPWEKFEDDTSTFSKKSGMMSFFGKLMIFDRKMKVKDDNLRYLQRKIVLQSCAGGALFATLMVGIVMCLPMWRHV